ncbi:hypothetical protein F2Q68_00032570 [Brassica cretica]|uniref:Uncharacterized protein n=3 Tax=Brassica cretica TaxID=69181 RepID=A0A8S9G6E1_BRACR|nr:hypothetical protein F2Q68_00032570 [Brassica cretica]KAF3527650.1 hypothetical protein DY000_02042875 [Brassica cretica]
MFSTLLGMFSRSGAFRSKAMTLDLKGHFTRADHVEVDERKNNRSMRIQCCRSTPGDASIDED